MNTKNSRKKLCLDKETLRTLEADHLIGVAGGAAANALGTREIPTIICANAGGLSPSKVVICPTMPGGC